ncbi:MULTISPECIES: cytochrome c7 [Geobacter]|uniref:Cytochrome C n=2 Tax=Geobacter TaxID=28231 RepID=A0A0C1QVI2_9BACT|nr:MULTISPECIES: cytochrome c7 [Geobacter]ANA40274.1 cytochrome C [Geobacter anodireducens]KIE42186.1 cytochrome C [Geobacter soli]MBE2888623.1 cytochrome c3 family protein [Geobacter anodireducens]HMN01574.1 cytochrome c3 family protein [Geobacter anodireducens]
MKRTVILFAAMLLTASAGLAADVILFPSKSGAVTFTHKRHSEFIRECRNCHEKTPGKITNFGKEYAHKTCKGCHEVRGAGPTKCKLCHRG